MKATGQKGDHTVKSMQVRSCVCSSDYQDKRYGKGQRAHNPTSKGWRCTVCGREEVL